MSTEDTKSTEKRKKRKDEKDAKDWKVGTTIKLEDGRQLKFEEETFVIRGAVFEVYRRTMGCGFLDAVRDIPFIAQHELQLCYKDQALRQFYKPDVIALAKLSLR